VNNPGDLIEWHMLEYPFLIPEALDYKVVYAKLPSTLVNERLEFDTGVTTGPQYLAVHGNLLRYQTGSVCSSFS
jgi:hypothetical protein